MRHAYRVRVILLYKRDEVAQSLQSHVNECRRWSDFLNSVRN